MYNIHFKIDIKYIYYLIMRLCFLNMAIKKPKRGRRGGEILFFSILRLQGIAKLRGGGG